MKLSAVIIAKNEENMIADCLDSVSFCDEQIVVDNGSTDRTGEIARHLGAKVFENSDDFDQANLRNLGLQKAKGEWILYIDADERVSDLLRKHLLSTIDNLPSKEIVAFKIRRKNFYFGNHQWPYIESLDRLFLKKKLLGWYGKVHESPKVEGGIGILDGYLLHYTHRDLGSMLAKTIEWSKIEAELRFNSSHPKVIWWRFPRVMFTGFYDSYIKQKGYKVGAAGLVESIFQAFSMFVTYARLWEMQHNKEQKTKD